MNLNCFKFFPYTKRYYARRPWKFVAQCWRNLRAAWQRAVHGHAWYDRCDAYSYILEMLSTMFYDMAKETPGYPATPPLETPEKYKDWLNSVGDVLHSLQDCEWEANHHNEWEELFDETMKQCRKKSIDENGYITYSYDSGDETVNEIRENYYKRDEELADERHRLLKDTFAEIAEHFFTLWY